MKMNKSLTIALIVLLSIIVLLLAGILTYMLVLQPSTIKIGGSSSQQVFCEDYYDAERIDSITIASDCGDIEIKDSTDNKVIVIAKGNNQNGFVIDSSSENLTLTYKSEKPYNLKSFECDITVYLPKGFDKPINIALGYGDVNAYEVSNISISNDYGDVEIDRISGKLNINSGYGDIEIGTIDISESSSIKSNLGDINIERTNDIRIDSTVSLGDNKINGSNSSSDIVLTVSADLGDIEIN